MTVLFADLKGSMELPADRDPEDARKLLDPVIEHMMEAIPHYEGTVNQVMGDGIMALFGAPVSCSRVTSVQRQPRPGKPLELARRHGERGNEAEALRALGEVIARAGGDRTEAAGYFLEALARTLRMRPLVAH